MLDSMHACSVCELGPYLYLRFKMYMYHGMLGCSDTCAQRASDKKNSSLENKRDGAGAWLQALGR